MKQTLTFLFVVLLAPVATANKRASEIYVDLQKLQSLKRVLYIAAHPDDENTRLLAYMSLGEKAETAYLSLTRGDGGQNLIGDELSEKLGVLRTQELLAARSYDGANQFFSRAVDFGYSKSAKESLEKWGHDAILSDVVYVIRKFRPDVIITRFPPDKRGGHGHHTASAMLAIEAFDKAADESYEPDQVEKFGTWQTTSLYWNTSYWWMKDIADSVAKYPDRYLTQEIGGYNPQLGMSYNEIGTIARSQHKCQGFGAVVERGPRMEYFEHLAGARLENSFFEKNNKSWSSIIDKNFENDLQDLVTSFDFVNTEANLDKLLSIQKRLAKMPGSNFKEEKLNLCNEIIINCLGLYIEVLSDDYSVVTSDSVYFSLNALTRIEAPITVDYLSINQVKIESAEFNFDKNNQIEANFGFLNKEIPSNPYWLERPFGDMFDLANMDNLGEPKGPAPFRAELALLIKGQTVTIKRTVEHKWRDPSYGERRREVISTPKFAVNFENQLQLVKPGETKKIRIELTAFQDHIHDEILIRTPEGWNASPSTIKFDLDGKYDQSWLEFDLSASPGAKNGVLKLEAHGKQASSYTEIEYDHIPTQTLQLPAELQCILLDAEIKAGKIAYVNGVKDAVPQAINQLGFDCDVLEVADLSDTDLSQYQSVVLGIRAYNVYPELFNHTALLHDYVEKGGNLIMQYNTASRAIRDKEFGPTPFKLSRNRVTEEDAEVTFLEKEHQILNSPNKLSKKDFDHWVQERGLYFANDWSDKYKPLLAWHDIGEEDQKGSLIVAKHGKGQFIYTGISFFRELPKGVVGAYRLFANILSYEPEK